MDDNTQNSNDEIADFRQVFDKSNTVVETSEVISPAQTGQPKNLLTKRPGIVILIATIIMAIGLIVVISFLNNQSGEEQIKDTIPLALPQSSGQK